jgi:endonuclease YncB( thermonuclease family)
MECRYRGRACDLGQWDEMLVALLASASLLAGLTWAPQICAAASTAGESKPRGETTLEGRVTRVVDGDTIDLQGADEIVRVRLAEIDAPERDQPYFEESRTALAELVGDERVRVVVTDTGKYGRAIGKVYLGELYVNAEMVRLGHAWVYTKYAKSTALIDDGREARAARRGLWQLPLNQLEEPWLHRQGGAKAASSAPANVECGTKRRCGQMSSCAEARGYLETCGVRSLDGDRDGIPCETLCRNSR